MSEITFEFACRDDCLAHMVPSDLRKLVKQRDEAQALLRDIIEMRSQCFIPEDDGRLPTFDWTTRATIVLAGWRSDE